MKKISLHLFMFFIVMSGLLFNAIGQTRHYPDLRVTITTGIPGTGITSDCYVYIDYSDIADVNCPFYRNYNIDIFRDGDQDGNIAYPLAGEGRVSVFHKELAVGPASYHRYGLRYREYNRYITSYSCNEYSWSGFKKNSNGVWEPNPATSVEDKNALVSLGRYSVLISANTVPIKSPYNLTATKAVHFDRIVLQWAKGTNIPDDSHRYNVYRGKTTNPADAVKIAGLSGAARIFTDWEVVPNDVYYYWVTTYTTNFGTHESPRTTTNGVQGTAKTITVKASDGTFSNTIKVEWDNLSSFFESIRIEKSIPNSAEKEVLASLIKTDTVYRDGNVIPGCSYTYYITPIKTGRTFPTLSDKGYSKPNGSISGTVKSLLGAGVDSVLVCARPVTAIPAGGIAVPVKGYCTYTGSDGFFEIRDIYYFDKADFVVTPYKPGLIKVHDFDPDSSRRTLDTGNPRISLVNFTDISVFTVGGKVTFPLSSAGKECGVPGVEILLNGQKANIITNSDGIWNHTLQNEGQFTFRPVFKNHSFVNSQGQPESSVKINDDKTDINFTDVKVDSIKVRVISGCGNPVADYATVEVTSPNVCYSQQFQTDKQGLLTLRDLPAHKYDIKVIGLSPPNSNILAQIGKDPISVDLTVRDTVEVVTDRDSITSITPADTIRFPNGTVQITPADTVLTTVSDTIRQEVIPAADFIYHSPLKVTVDFREAGAEVVCEDKYVLMEQNNTYKLYFNINESVGGCPVMEGVLTIYDFVSDRGDAFVNVPIKNGTAIYTIHAGIPEIAESENHNHEKLLYVIPQVGSLPPEALSYWIFVTGVKTQARTFFTSSPDIPMLVLHDPPGDQSYAYVNKGTSVTSFSTHEVLVGGEGGIYSNITAGAAVLSTKAGGVIKLTLTGGRDNFNRNGLQTTVTFDEKFSTSNQEDLTGHGGDVFIGAAFDQESSFADRLTFDKTTCKPVIDSILAVNWKGFKTTFIYTENHIKNTLIPNFKRFYNTTLAGRELSQLTKSEKEQAVEFKLQISNWENILAQNDLNRGANAKYVEKITFSGGVEISREFTTDSVESSSYEYHQLVNSELAIGGRIENDQGFWTETDIGYVAKFRYSNNVNTGNDSLIHRTVGYVLNDNDVGDSFSVDIKTDKAYSVPAFDLWAGTTSCPFESGSQPRDDARIKIYPPEVTRVPIGGVANFTASLTNESQSREQRKYAVKVISNTNPEGAIVKLGGQQINFDPVTYTIDFNQTANIALTVEKGPLASQYDSIGIVMYPPCEEGNIGSDTAWINAGFQRECPPVSLFMPMEGWLVNQNSNSLLNVAITGYDINDELLESITLQRKKESQDWMDVVTIAKDSLIDYFYDYPFDVSGLSDGAYKLRAVANCLAEGTLSYSPEKSGVIDRKSIAPFGIPTPSDGLLKQGQEISVTFDKNVSCDLSGAFIKLLLEDSTEIPVTPQCYGNKIILMPQNDLFLQTNLEGVTLYAKVRDVKDLSGNVQKYPINWSFVLVKRMGGFVNLCPVPGIQCPDNKFVASEPGLCGAQVFFPDAKASLDCGGMGIKIEQTGGLPSGYFYPFGVTTNTYLLTNAVGKTATCSFDVTVYDGEPPVISDISAEMYNIWPPEPGTIPVALNYTSTDNCGKTRHEIYVRSREIGLNASTRSTSVGYVLMDDHHILLNAERSGPGEGREYTIFIRCWDEAGYITLGKTTIFIPHDNSFLKSTGTTEQMDLNPVKPANMDKRTRDGSFMATVWPNPSNKSFNLEVNSSSDEKIDVSVLDILGRLILKPDVTTKQPSSFGENLTPGIYFITVSQGHSFKNIKVVKQ